jgi:ComF family protein
MHLLVPSSCAFCGASDDDAICIACHAQFFVRPDHRCAQCAIQLPEPSSPVCGDCLKRAPAFDATIAAADYAPPIDQLVLALKFGNRLELAPLFARLLRDALLPPQQKNGAFPASTLATGESAKPALPDQLIAVPLGARRLAERGFNQALEIAKPFGRALGVKLNPSLVLRVRDTQAQAMLHPDERHKNIRHAFIVSQQAIDSVQGQHIGVVDDVMTTGETLNELAATLKRFGAARVTNFVFARTPPK